MRRPDGGGDSYVGKEGVGRNNFRFMDGGKQVKASAKEFEGKRITWKIFTS